MILSPKEWVYRQPIILSPEWSLQTTYDSITRMGYKQPMILSPGMGLQTTYDSITKNGVEFYRQAMILSPRMGLQTTYDSISRNGLQTTYDSTLEWNGFYRQPIILSQEWSSQTTLILSPRMSLDNLILSPKWVYEPTYDSITRMEFTEWEWVSDDYDFVSRMGYRQPRWSLTFILQEWVYRQPDSISKNGVYRQPMILSQEWVYRQPMISISKNGFTDNPMILSQEWTAMISSFTDNL
ncbi:unnamed protein product [Mytilus coruscus]|uniref:Uncharacterized protein n=1 Tax=Mytilus coruscus TaxID=42192 RepID=A0A6J8ARW9_MYTCO|nr:unnamed protein product [Mytilus coruscus]